MLKHLQAVQGCIKRKYTTMRVTLLKIEALVLSQLFTGFKYYKILHGANLSWLVSFNILLIGVKHVDENILKSLNSSYTKLDVGR